MAVQSVSPIAAGYVYKVRLQVTGEEPLFPAGCRLRAQVRPFEAAELVAGILTTENGGIVRVDDMTIDLVMPAELTDAINNDRACLDLARVDVEPDEWLGLALQLPVVEPITRAEA
jgi:hypothetical protein